MSVNKPSGKRKKRWFSFLTAPFRAQARFIARRLDGEAQMALGSFCADTAVPLFLVGFFVEEPFIVYQMSAGALLFTGLGFIASGQALLEAQCITEAQESNSA